MKQERNNEIDLLLRRLGRRADGGVSDPDDGHLDADELSSYAENVLPPAARARYTEHLAQCSSCRTMVVQLSSAAGVVVAPERAVVAAPSGFMKFLASLFSPMVLRYAIPALGLAVIAVIGLTVFRPDQQPAVDVARQTNAPAPANEQSSPSTSGFHSDGNKAETAKSVPAPAPDEDSINMAKAPAPGPTAADKISAPADDASGASAEPPPAPTTEVQPLTTTPAPTPAAPEVAERKVEVPLEKQEVQRRIDAATAQRERALRSRDESANEAAPAAPSEARPAKKRDDFARAKPQGAGTGSVAQTESSEKDTDDGEVRSVAGRRFRKKRGVWVDTSYDGSSETMNLARGSERYRSIVADEPGIKSIADQLEGEIIVVWKGRPYRIR